MNDNRISLSGQDRPVLFFFLKSEPGSLTPGLKVNRESEARFKKSADFSNLCYNRIYADICLPTMDGRSSGLIPEKCP